MTNFSWLATHAPETMRKKPSTLAPSNQFPCRLKLAFYIYFDGTRNSRDEDEKTGSLSNIAKLYEITEYDERNCEFRLYVQGVGTRFPIIGEHTPHPDGAKEGAMGDRRIRYAMLFIANRVGRISNSQVLVPEIEAAITHAVQNDNLIPAWREALLTMLAPRVGAPKIDEITLDLFGFSRGATAARSFLNQLLKHFGNNDNTFCGIPLRVRFMGLFDTVASVGLADPYPLPVDGHQGWGDAPLLKIPPCVEQCVHFVAAHENRNSFPVDLVLDHGSYPANCLEIVYPGMHSDVGGGYGENTQGKGTQLADGSVRHSQADKLSQIALIDMYQRARKAGVPLQAIDELDDIDMVNDFAISPELQNSFDAYMSQFDSLKGGAPVTEHLLAHRKLYLGWRKQVLAEEHFSNLSFVRSSDEQDRVDMIDANRQLRQRVEAYSKQVGLREFLEKNPNGVATHMERGFHLEWHSAPAPPPAVCLFLEQYVHDSRAHFVLTDPQGEDDHHNLENQLEETDRLYQQQMVIWREQQKAEHQDALRGKYVVPSVPPSDPLGIEGREALTTYRSGNKPVFSDERPASAGDGSLDGRDLIYRVSGRRENWSYLRLRQLFDGKRVHYAPAVLRS